MNFSVPLFFFRNISFAHLNFFPLSSLLFSLYWIYTFTLLFLFCVICFWKLPFVFLNGFNSIYFLIAVSNTDFIWKMPMLIFSISFLKLVISLLIRYLLSSFISFISFLNSLLRIPIIFRFFKRIVWFKFAFAFGDNFFLKSNIYFDLCLCVSFSISLSLCFCPIFSLWDEQIAYS